MEWLLGALAIVLGGGWFFSKNKVNLLEILLKGASLLKKDASLEADKKINDASIAQEKALQERLKREAEAAAGRELSPSEVENFWNKK